MDLDSDDEVIGEIPVYFRTCQSHQIALINFPLRPKDKPYEGSDLGALHQVQIKPEHGTLQFQYRSERRLDPDSPEARVFTLTSNQLRPQSTYAMGRICDGQLHLTPIDQVHTMLPNFAAVDAAAAAARASMRTVTDADHEAPETKTTPKEVLLRAAQTKTASGEPSEVRKSFQLLRQEWDAEKWVSLQVQPVDSGSSAALRSLLTHVDMDVCERIAMEVPLPNYLGSLSSPVAGSGAAAPNNGASLQARCFHLLKNAGVMQFGDLCDVLGVADDARDDLVKVLVARSVLVQNCWTPKSSLLVSGRASIARDYLLQLFSMGRELPLSDWTQVAHLDLETSLQIMRSLATLDPVTKRWVFKCEFDYVFGASYEDVVADQNRALQRIDALRLLTEMGAVPVPSSPDPARSIDKTQIAVEAATPSASTAAIQGKSDEAAAGVELDPDVRYFVSEQLEQFGVVTISSLLAAYRGSGRTVTEAAMNAALNAIARPFIGSGFCRKLIDANDDVFEMFRNAFIEMYQAAPSKALRKADIKAEILQRTKVELSEKAYSKLTKEFARLVKGSWIAKTAE